MKKLMFLVMLLLASSCSEQHTDPRDPNTPTETREEFVIKHSSLVDLTYDGETHQYVLFMFGYTGSVSH